MALQAEAFDLGFGTRVQRPGERQFFGDGSQRLQNTLKRRFFIDISRTVQRDDAVAAGCECQVFGRGRGFNRFSLQLERVDHDIADQCDLVFGDALVLQVQVAVLRRRPENIRNGIGQDAVDFLGHAAVEAAQACFQMRDFDAKFRCRKRAADGRIDVADHNRDVGLVLIEAESFVTFDHAGGLRALPSRSHFKIEIGLGQAQIAEKRAGHVIVIVLAGVDQLCFKKVFFKD